MIRRAAHSAPPTVEDVGVDHRGPQVPVAQELLDGADVVTVLQEMGGEGVPEGVATRRFGDAGPPHRTLHGPLENRFVQVVAAPLGSFPI